MFALRSLVTSLYISARTPTSNCLIDSHIKTSTANKWKWKNIDIENFEFLCDTQGAFCSCM